MGKNMWLNEEKLKDILINFYEDCMTKKFYKKDDVMNLDGFYNFVEDWAEEQFELEEDM
jgi:hypothetical protein